VIEEKKTSCPLSSIQTNLEPKIIKRNYFLEEKVENVD